MTLVGLDLNAGRLRAVQGRPGDFPSSLPLGGDADDLPLTLSLESSRVEVGSAGEKLRRCLPHLTCHGFLPHLGEARRWEAGKHRLDSAQALDLVWRSLPRAIGPKVDAVLSLPGYLSRWQADQVRHLASKAGLNMLGSLPSPLAAALAGFAEQHWNSSVLVVDLDEHALCLALVEAVGPDAHLRELRQFPHLGYHAWRERLINALADCCVLQSRRDPRDCGQAEQGIYEQLGLVFQGCSQDRLVQLAIRANNWFQNLVISPEESLSFCAPLVRQAVREIQKMLWSLGASPPQTVLLTSDVARLPGLALAVSQLVETNVEPSANGQTRPPSDDDFGINLLRDSGEDHGGVHTLAPAACARAAFALAGAFQRGDLPREHLEAVAPLPSPWPAESGPPRLAWQGRTFTLDGSTFLVGTQTGCHLHVDPASHPGVEGQHCEIFFDHRTYVLFNRGREGTLLNGVLVHSRAVLHPGDRIRLGPHGPTIKFLGQHRPL